jgi:plastocyanin
LASALLVGAPILLAGCGGSTGSGGSAHAPLPSTPSPTIAAHGCVPAATDGNGGPYPAAASADCTGRKIVEVDIVNDPKTTGAFSPSNITISAGTTVKFVWKSSNHNLSPFHTDIEDAGYVFLKSFGKTGQFQYSCQVHPGQNGVIYVR